MDGAGGLVTKRASFCGSSSLFCCLQVLKTIKTIYETISGHSLFQ